MVNSASVTSAQQATNPSTKSKAPSTSGKLGIQHHARKVVSDLMLAAGFAPMTSPPINFEQMYYERTQSEGLATTE